MVTPTSPTGCRAKTSRTSPAADINKVIEACPSHGWKAMFALCRFAGLRRGEALSLLWSGTAEDSDGVQHQVGIDWDNRLIRMIGNHKKGGLRLRIVPIDKDTPLYDILLNAFDVAPEGTVSVTGMSENNLNRDGRRIVKAAKLEPWADLFQRLRSSAENDWKRRGVAEPTYCRWIGHDEKTSRKHYVSPTDSELEAVTGVAPQ